RFVKSQTALDHFFIRIVETIVFQRPLLQARKESIPVRAGKMKDLLHVDQLIHDFGLPDISWNPIEHQHIDVGFEGMRVHGRIDLRFPQLDGDFIRDELAFARVLEKSATYLRPRVNRPKNVSTGAMKKARDAAKRVALG